MAIENYGIEISEVADAIITLNKAFNAAWTGAIDETLSTTRSNQIAEITGLPPEISKTLYHGALAAGAGKVFEALTDTKQDPLKWAVGFEVICRLLPVLAEAKG